jgi:hypothetical protein
VRRHGVEKQEVLPLDTVIKMLTEEAVPPDVKRAPT